MEKKITLDETNAEVLRHWKANKHFSAANLIDDDYEVNQIVRLYFKEHGFADVYEEGWKG